MKKYKYTYSKLIIGLFILGIIIAVACLALNLNTLILNIRANNEVAGYDYFKFILIFALSILFIVIAISCLISSYYTIENKTFVLAWGFIKNKFDLVEVTELKYYKEKNRLELVFKDESYFYVATKQEWVGSLVDDIKNANSKIIYIEDSAANETK